MNSAHEFGQLYDSVRTLERTGFAQPAALATVTRTSGSTFRHAGSSMLVHASGEVVCALSGGCPQHDIVERARRVIAEDAPQLARYDRDSGLDVLLEMGCGGELDVLIEPLSAPRDVEFLHALAEAHARREAGIMATAFARRDGVLAPRPQRLVHAGRTLWNDLAGDAEAAIALEFARLAPANARVQRSEDGTELLLEALRPRQRLVLVGINAVSLALAASGAALGWSIELVDTSPGGDAAPPGVQHARVLRAAPRELAAHLGADPCCAAVAMTFKLEQDLAFLRELANLPLLYLGAIGSRERGARMRAQLGATRVPLYSPAGLDLGADTPQEIALAIAAQITACRNARSAAALCAATPAGG